MVILPITRAFEIFRLLEKNTKKSNYCWEWTGAQSDGYGLIRLYGKALFVHRLVAELHYGEPPHNAVVMHICDNPPCIRPDHLKYGTQLQNMQDADKKDRRHRGSRMKNAKLNEELVAILRTRVANGESQVSLGAEYGINPGLINHAVNRRTWKHVP
jgi:HNH endonuclease